MITLISTRGGKGIAGGVAARFASIHLASERVAVRNTEKASERDDGGKNPAYFATAKWICNRNWSSAVGSRPSTSHTMASTEQKGVPTRSAVCASPVLLALPVLTGRGEKLVTAHHGEGVVRRLGSTGFERCRLHFPSDFSTATITSAGDSPTARTSRMKTSMVGFRLFRSSKLTYSRVSNAFAANSSCVIAAVRRACFSSVPNTPPKVPLDDRPVCEL